MNMTWTPQRASFPHLRHRRKRQNGWIRDMVRENRLNPGGFYPSSICFKKRVEAKELGFHARGGPA